MVSIWGWTASVLEEEKVRWVREVLFETMPGG